ncbi:MAG TPA: glycosyl transferase family 2 [Bacteroidales bacterium]|nr:glycosyl transferase family 2 [Bacteroidales bacterium]
MNLLPEVSIIIPAYNEADRLPAHLQSVLNYFKELNMSHEIIIVDDGSSDNIARIVETFESDFVKVVRHPNNVGKGQAIKTGMSCSKGDLRLFTDADGSTPITEFSKLLHAMKNGADVAVGSRSFTSSECVINALLHRKIIGKIFRSLVYLLAVKNIKDTQCGFKLFSKQTANYVFPRQKISGFGFDVEILHLCNLSGFKIMEVPVNWSHVPGSKINLLKDSCIMFFEIIKIRYYQILGAYNLQRY